MGFQGYLFITIVAIVIVAVVGYVLVSGVFSTATQTGSQAATEKNLLLSLTDPATVPAGTTALFVTFSAMQIQVSNNGQTSTQSLPGSGTVNVLNLRNASIILATANVPNGSKVTQVKVNISNAVITIGGKNYTVVIGEGTLVVNLTTNNTVFGQKHAVLDLIPAITVIETIDKTIYVLTPNVRGVMPPPGMFARAPGANGIQPPPGQIQNFTSGTNLSQVFRAVTPTISITSASLSASGNDTSLSVTVRNTGNSSVQLNGLMLNGSKEVFFPLPPASLLFKMPSIIFPFPAVPRSMMPANASAVTPEFTVTFPNGTVMNTTDSFPMQPPPNSSNYPPPQQQMKIYIIDLIKPAYAISLNSTGAVINMSGENVVVEDSVPPSTLNQNMGPSYTDQNGHQVPGNITIPQNSTVITLPIGTTMYISFPSSMTPPKMPSVPQTVLTQLRNAPTFFMIFPNGTIGFPPVSMTQQAASGPASEFEVSNISSQPPSSAQIPKGYTLAANSSVTFTLNGLLVMGPSPTSPTGAPSNIVISPPFAVPISGNVYGISVIGMAGAHAQTQITAS